MSRIVVRDCDVLIRPGELREGVDLVLDRGVVAAVEAHAPLDPADRVFDPGLLAIPGLVNAHTHSPENCLRGIGEGLALEPWLLLMFGSAGVYSAHEHYICALAGALEMLKTGTTACVDHLWMTPPSVEAVDAAFAAYRDAGIRAAVAPLMSDSDTTPELAAVLKVDAEEVSLARRLRLLPTAELVGQLGEVAGHWHGKQGGRLSVLAGLGGVQWCSDELLVGLHEVARRHGTGIHLHLLETALQDAVCRLRFGTSAVAALDRLGLLGDDCSLAHCVQIDGDDVALIAERGAVVVHNPAANLRLSSGRMPLSDLLREGARIAIGTDGAASSDSQVLWDCLKVACLLHNESHEGAVLASDVLRAATAGGAAVLGDSTLGTLEPGAPADLVLLDRHAAGLAGAVELETSLVLSDVGRAVRHVLVGGEVVVEDGRCTRIDEDEVLAELKQLAIKRRPDFRDPPPTTQLAMRQAAELRRALAASHAN